MIEPCRSEWSSPVTLVPKHDGSQRLCLDYRKVNQVTRTDAYPIPRMEDCLDKKEIDYLLEHDMIEPCRSEWSSPVTLVPKHDGSQRLCLDYRKVNQVTRTDAYPIPRMEDCLDKKEIDYLLEHDMIEPCRSEWSSPVTLVPKHDGSQRLCLDYRKVNQVTRTDAYPIPRMEDCLDKVGKASLER
ncbi:hypothetical protein Pmani_012925 [Petrolisthes manimaculis]|uniref:Reverse transcriptase n=1 Tax=Petrolisthes manimaculis TaxID=1843537 RepID=A0AAE1UEM4_9EUCA|nr:hypothetical protein Pmani_012925 [Petrolisthes manimaculis]